MSTKKLLLCTDMDRTVIPNGVQSEHKFARKRFSEFCRIDQVSLVYVTGRHLSLVEDAVKRYSLPSPDFLITDVGTKIYQADGKGWQELLIWQDEISHDWNGYNHQGLKNILNDFSQIKLQEHLKQNTYKLSYYVPLYINQEALLAEMTHRLEQADIKASLIWSIDEPKGVGLLDVLPRNATKLHAIEFLYRHLGYTTEEVVFAGDSGNDLPVMGSEIPSVLVANSAIDVWKTAEQMAEASGNSEKLYFACGKNSDMNGNYSAGVLEGVGHFIPTYRQQLKQLGFDYGQ